MPDILKGQWSKAAIGGLVLLNVVLLTLLALDGRSRSLAAQAVPADQAPATQPSATATRPSPTSTPTSRSPEPTPSSTAARLPSSTVSPSTGQGPVKRLLAANSASLAWRAVMGPCPTDPQVEVTRDGGRTWRPTDSGLQSISRMRSYNESAVFAVGGDEECESQYSATGGPDESWEILPRFLGQTWFRLPDADHRIHAPGGRSSSPCGDELTDFAGLGVAGGAAICTDGTVRLTQNGGRRWRDLDEVTTGRAIGADEQVYVLAMRRGDCDGIGVVLLDPEAEEVDSDSVRCAPIGGDPDQELAVAVSGQVLWLSAGEEVAVSTDRGRNWQRP